jgi:hypothetical protein
LNFRNREWSEELAAEGEANEDEMSENENNQISAPVQSITKNAPNFLNRETVRNEVSFKSPLRKVESMNKQKEALSPKFGDPLH